ncbi:hypothetical protein E2C01_027335 [Portunus trituberculatus]|uniref:Uncharacterized protein n=1 Tax=Portunus trituberculatus TaxID=210409 RepID=A0A5B7EKJ7_PORTR|nr:hypothetical protein [Portunus trituberculatus]
MTKTHSLESNLWIQVPLITTLLSSRKFMILPHHPSGLAFPFYSLWLVSGVSGSGRGEGKGGGVSGSSRLERAADQRSSKRLRLSTHAHRRALITKKNYERSNVPSLGIADATLVLSGPRRRLIYRPRLNGPLQLYSCGLTLSKTHLYFPIPRDDLSKVNQHCD